MSKHTKSELRDWTIEESIGKVDYDSEFQPIQLFKHGSKTMGSTWDISIAEHIVSCVNNCAGINPEAIPDMVKLLTAISIFRDTLAPNTVHSVLRDNSIEAYAALVKAGVIE